MTQTIKVPFSTETVSQCLCPGCPVQVKSSCVGNLKQGLEESLKKNPLQSDDIPGLYCSTGKATCTDLDSSESCLCTECSVFSRYGLVKGHPVGYYCQEGPSD